MKNNRIGCIFLLILTLSIMMDFVIQSDFLYRNEENNDQHSETNHNYKWLFYLAGCLAGLLIFLILRKKDKNK